MRGRRIRTRRGHTAHEPRFRSARARSRQAKSSKQRRRRARNHLERMTRSRSQLQLTGPPRGRRTAGSWNIVLAFLALGCLTVGFLGAQPLTQAGLAHWSGHPPQLKRLGFVGHRSLAVADLAAASGMDRGMPLATVDPAAVAQQLEAHEWIAEAEVAVLPNGTALVEIRERIPAAVLVTKSDPEGRLVDETGVSFTAARSQDREGDHLFSLHSDQIPEKPRLAQAVELAASVARLQRPRLHQARIEIPALSGADVANPAGWVVRSADGELEIVLGGEADSLDPHGPMAQRLSRLRQILAASLFEEPARGRIDLRFEDQAVLTGSLVPTSSEDGPHRSSRKETSKTWREGADALSRPEMKCSHHAAFPGGKDRCEKTT